MSWYDYFLTRTERLDNGCLIWLGAKQPRGYGTAILDGQSWLVHRYIAWCQPGVQFTLEEFKLVTVMHTCDNTSCLEPSHLRIGTQGNNIKDTYNKNRRNARGENNAFSKFTETQVKEIREKYASDQYTQVQLAAQYETNQGSISGIILRKSWAHVP